MIEIRKLSKTFVKNENDFCGLNEIDLTIDDGIIYGIIGLSGAGKTTLLRCLATLEKPTSGEILIDSKDIVTLRGKELKKYRTNIGVVFQGYQLLLQRTVFDNIAFPLKLRHYSKTFIEKRVMDLLKLVGLENKKNEFPAKLSGGEAQRIAIARALATSPKLLLLDEVTSALDPITTKQILMLLKKINVEEKVTMIVITHTMSVVSTICDKVAVLNYGDIVEQGSVQQILNNPEEEITKSLLGKKVF